MDSLFGPFHGESQMIGQGNNQIGVGFIGQVILDNGHMLGGEGQDIGGDVAEHVQVMAVQVVKGPLNLAQGQLGGGLGKAHAFSKHNDLAVVTVETERHVVIDIFDNYHTV